MKRALMVLVLFLFLFLLVLLKPKENQPQDSQLLTQNNLAQVTIGQATLTVEIAKTENAKQQGLSGRKSLDENSGMLFVWDTPVIPSFWMKDMNFPLDFIWILNDQVVDLTENVPYPEARTLDENLPRYKPKGLVNYVLEVRSGFISLHNIKIGDQVSFINFQQ